MAKFNSEGSGWNAGKNYYAHPVRLSDITIDDDISRLFLVKDSTVEEITESIKENDYDKAQPITVWKVNEKKVLLDGHTRYKAAQAAGLDEVPAVEKEFGDKEEALLYAFERQVIRRNLTPDEILTVAEQFMRGRKAKNGKGRAAELWAARLGISAAQLYKAKKVVFSGNEKLINEVRSGEKTIREGYRELTPPKKERYSAPAVLTFGNEKIEIEEVEETESAPAIKESAEIGIEVTEIEEAVEALEKILTTRGAPDLNDEEIETFNMVIDLLEKIIREITR